MNKLKVGFIGCGRHATKTLYPSLRYAPISLEATCDLDKRLARRNARWFGAPRHFTDYGAMLAECELDAVIVVTGPTSHSQITGDIVARGLPVFVEKPPALSLGEAEKLAQLSDRLGQSITVGMMKRHTPAYQRVRDIINTAAFGPISHVQATFRIGQKQGTGFALLLDAGIHLLDLVRFLAGEVLTIRAETWQGETGLAYAILMRFENGAVGSVHISDQGSWFHGNEILEITGTGQFVRSENLVRVHHSQKDGQTYTWEPGFSIPQNQNNTLFIQGYAPQLLTWARTLINGDQPEPSIADTCQTMRLIRAIEPDEAYAKEPLHFPHWQAEDAWLVPDEFRQVG
jgi:myo-inositol 2-dehydrogenase/D-chiro-inositol 1-dehydrogenase